MNISKCEKLPLQFLNMNTPLAKILTFFACVGLLTVAMVFVIFLKNSQNKLIIASGREMCYFMLLGIAAIFAVPLTALSRPTQVRCYVERFIMGTSYAMCYAPLLMKTFRIHRIFLYANQLRPLSPSGLIGSRSLLLITTGLVAVQGLSCALVFASDPPHLLERYYPKRNKLVLECDHKRSTFAIYFMYDAILIAWCTFYAFRTRHFRKNFNEALHIGITMYLTCMLWVIFFATFLNSDYSISRVYWVSSTSLLIGWVTLIGFFMPKIYHLWTKKEFPKENLLTWDESSFNKTDATVDNVDICQRCHEVDQLVDRNSRDLSPQANCAHSFENQIELEVPSQSE